MERTHRELSGTHRREIETELSQCCGMLFGGGDVDRFGIEHRGNQQRLRRQSLLVERVLELLVQDAFVRRMHVYDHQTLVFPPGCRCRAVARGHNRAALLRSSAAGGSPNPGLARPATNAR
jgi:GAF domain-containing protein